VKRVAWFIAIYVASVIVMAVATYLLRSAVRL
jgi:hypothetical protein